MNTCDTAHVTFEHIVDGTDASIAHLLRAVRKPVRTFSFPRTIIVGIGHRARNGKESLAKAMASISPDVKIYSWADPVYSVARIFFGMQQKDAPLLQKIGNAFRADNDLVWINETLARIEKDAPLIAVIPDTRYVNEANLCDVTIRVRRMKADGTQFIADDRDPQHPSECELDDYPWMLRVDVPDDPATFDDEMANYADAILESVASVFEQCVSERTSDAQYDTDGAA